MRLMIVSKAKEGPFHECLELLAHTVRKNKVGVTGHLESIPLDERLSQFMIEVEDFMRH